MLFYRTSEGARASRGAANRGGFLNVRDEDSEQKRHAEEPGQGHHEVHHVEEELQPGDDQQQQEPTETDAGVGELQRRGLGQGLRWEPRWLGLADWETFWDLVDWLTGEFSLYFVSLIHFSFLTGNLLPISLFQLTFL